MKRNLGILTLSALLLSSATLFAQVPLGTAANFGVLGGSTVTNTGPTVVTGNLGVSPGSSVTGFPPGVVVSGTIHAADAVAAQAQSDLTIAYNAASGLPCGTNLTGQDLGGLTLTPGVYCFSSVAALTGTLTLDLQGNPNALFVFQIGSSLTTASGSSVLLTNAGATTCPPNVYWQVGSSATLGTGSTFVGNILALQSITMTTGGGLNGRTLARNGAVTLDSNSVTSCSAGSVCPAITVNPAMLPPGIAGSPYNATVTATGGTAPYTFAVTTGALPPGLTLNPTTGAISGTPTAPAATSFTITATDANGCTGSRTYGNPIGAANTGIPALDYAGLAVLAVLLAGVGLFVTSRVS